MKHSQQRRRIGFVGAGQMASALAGGFLRTEQIAARELFAVEVVPEAAARFAERTGATILPSIAELVDSVDVIFLAVKPSQLKDVLPELRKRFEPSGPKTTVSLAAGITLDHLGERLGTAVPRIRIMPNTPCLVGCGVCGISASEKVEESELQWIRLLLESVGIAVFVPETQLDAITGLSGSGPAFGYVIVESLSDGAVRMGLPRELATRLAAQTLKGAAEMILQTGEHPGVLKDRVASPGGTTIAGLAAMEEKGVRAGVIAAVIAATERSREMRTHNPE